MLVFLFTSIEEYTEKWEKFQKKMGKVLDQHDTIFRKQIERHEGRIIKHTGDGIFAVFDKGAPLYCAIEIQKQFAGKNWGEIGELRIRIGLHAGDAEKRGDDYFGPVINRTARIMEAAWGGQILLTSDVATQCSMPPDAILEDCGIHIFSELDEPQLIYELKHPDLKLKDFPPIRSLSARPHNLPFHLNPFIGREKELLEISKLFEDPLCHIVNIIGPGGIGKTRLALQVAAKKIDKFKDGVYFVPLDALAIGSIQFLVFAIADVLKFTFYSREDPKLQLINYLIEKEMLLVLDSFEHLTSEAGLLSEILLSAPNVKFIVTSRERLRLKGERIIELKGMKIPKRKEKEKLEAFSSVQLFLQNARRVKTDFLISDKNREDIVKICQKVEGIPLGIELAASWVRSLSCKEIAQEIEKGLDFLTTRLRDVPEGHRSLRSVFEHSWELLSKKEQRILSRLSLFSSGFQRESAEKIAGASLQSLLSLVDKSLLRRNPQGRYEILKVIRQYAQEKLEKDPEEKKEIENLYCKYFTDFVHKQEQDFQIVKEKRFLDTINEEIENIRLAWYWAIENGKVGEISKLLTGVYHFFEGRSWLLEGEDALRKGIEKIEQRPCDEKTELLLAKLLARKGSFCRRLSSYEKAKDVINQSLEIFSKYGIKKEIAFALNELGVIAYRFGDYTQAMQFHQKSFEIRKKHGNKRGIADSYNNMGVVAASVGDYSEAKRLHTKSMEIRQSIGDVRGLAASMNNLANVYKMEGGCEMAKKLYQESLRVRREIGDRFGIASSLNNLGMIVEDMGDYEEAKQLYLESLEIKRNIGDQRGVGNTLDNLGSISSKQGEYEEAKKYFYDGLETFLKIGMIPGALIVMTSLAKLYVKLGEKEKALRNIALILHHPASSREIKEIAEHLYVELKADMSVQKIADVHKDVEMRRPEVVMNDILKEK